MPGLPESLSDKLRSLGVQTGAQNITPAPKTSTGIEDVVDGIYLQTRFGDIFRAEVANGLNYTHGNVPFLTAPVSPRLIKWAVGQDDPAGIDLSSTLFLDTETTGLAGGTGTLPFMIGAGRFTPDGFVTSQLFTRNPAEERAQLDELDRMLAGITSIVTYNGKSFDIPILKTRYVMNAMPSPFADLVHFDLLPLSRRLWRRRLENRSLKDIETEVLGFSRSQLEVPGWKVPVIYFNYLRTGDPSQLAGVFYHNAIDIQSLAALFLYMNDMAEHPHEASALPSLDVFSMAVQLEATGEIEKAIVIYEQLLEVELPEGYSAELQLRYSRILKQNGEYERAASVLHSGGELNNLHVLIQLAKVLEHHQRDYVSALAWTDKALELLASPALNLPTITVTRHRAELVKRRERLCQKLQRTGSE